MIETKIKPSHIADRHGPNIIASAFRGEVNAVKALLDTGVDPNFTFPDVDDTPLITAARQGHLNVVKLLIERGAHMEMGTKYFSSALNAAALNSHKHVVDFLLSNGCKNTLTLGAAATIGDLAKVKELVDAGEYPNRHYNPWRETPLFLARMNGHQEVAEMLVKAGGHEGNLFDYLKERFRTVFRRTHIRMLHFLLSYPFLVLSNLVQCQVQNQIGPDGFSGQQTDCTKLVNCRARLYEAKTGTFVSEDPIVIAEGIKTFQYCGNVCFRFAGYVRI